MRPAARHADDTLRASTLTWEFLHPLGLTASCVVRPVAKDGPWQVLTTIDGQIFPETYPTRTRAMRRALDVAASLNAGRWYSSDVPPRQLLESL